MCVMFFGLNLNTNRAEYFYYISQGVNLKRSLGFLRNEARKAYNTKPLDLFIIVCCYTLTNKPVLGVSDLQIKFWKAK